MSWPIILPDGSTVFACGSSCTTRARCNGCGVYSSGPHSRGLAGSTIADWDTQVEQMGWTVARVPCRGGTLIYHYCPVCALPVTLAVTLALGGGAAE